MGARRKSDYDRDDRTDVTLHTHELPTPIGRIEGIETFSRLPQSIAPKGRDELETYWRVTQRVMRDEGFELSLSKMSKWVP
jgi:hypothetical protein